MSKPKPLSVLEFFKQFPDDDFCLEHLMEVRYGLRHKCAKCGKDSKFHRVKKRPVYACQSCGYHINPMAGTPFESTRTPLQKWFYALYLFTTSRHGVPAKELQRQLSVTYKTAWRMGHEIRRYMGIVDGDDQLDGHVEVDEAYLGGKSKGQGQYRKKMTCVVGMMERGGDIITRVVPNNRTTTLIPIVTENVKPGTTVSTDERHAYKQLPKHGYAHGSVNHSADEWVDGIHHTNSIEGFWGRLKLSIKGTHVHVSRKHLPKYLAEFEFRYNNRKNPHMMLDMLLKAF